MTNKSMFRFSLLIILIALVSQNLCAQSGIHRLSAPVTDYPVQDIVYSNGYALLKGYFYKAGMYSGSVVSVGADDGVENPGWPVISGDVNVVIPDGNGGYYAGGAIRAVNNEDVGNLIHILPDKTLDRNFLPNPFGAVYALTLSDNILYVGGTFVNIGGQARHYAASFHTTTGTLTSWNPHPNNRVTAITVTNDAVVLAGIFTQINNGTSLRNKIAMVDKTNGTVSGWSVNIEGGAAWTINALAASSATLYIGGSFTKVNGVDRNGVAAVSLSNATLDADWNPSPLSTGTPVVHGLALSGSTLYIAGAYDAGLGSDNTIKHLAAVSASTGSLINTFKPVLDVFDQVTDITVSGETLYASGSFNSVNGLTRLGLAAIDINNGSPTGWAPRIEGGAYGIAVNGSEVLIAGDIPGINWEPYNGLALIEESTGKFWPHALQVPDTEEIVSMVVNGNTMYVGGNFTSINGIPRKNLAAVDLATGAVLPWNPGASGTTTTAYDDTRVTALEFRDNTVYVGGIFLNAGGQARRGLAAIDGASGVATTWNPSVGNGTGMDEYILSMDIHDDALFVSGTFTMLGGQPREFLGAVDLEDGTLINWHPDVRDEVRKVRVSGNTAYILGDFSGGVGGVARAFGFAAIDITTAETTSFNPQFNASTIADIAVTDTDIFFGGYFSTAENEIRPGLASFSLSTGELNAWEPDLGSALEGNYDVATLAVSATRLYVGGGFIYIGNENRQGYTEYDLVECASNATIVFNGTTLTASGGDSYLWFENGLPVTGATSQELAINIFEYGRYAVEVTTNGCTARSDDYVYLVTDLEDDSLNAIQVYPNPVTDMIFIDVPSNASLSVFDLSGKPVTHASLKFHDTNRISTEAWSKGPYIITIQNSSSTKSFKIIKSN